MYSIITNRRHQFILLLIAAFAIFVDSLDNSIVNVALPVIASEFGIEITTGSWIAMTYGLFLAGFILAFGRIADNGKIQKIFILGFTIFSLGSLLCAASMNLPVMIAARAVQGIGASMIAAAAPLIITRFLPGSKCGLGMGVIATTGGIALTFGPPLGGLLTEYLSWHWIFLINIPIGIAAIFFALAFIPRPETPPEKKAFDWTGMFLMFAAVACFVLLIERGASLGWTSPLSLSLMGLFAAAAAAYIIHSLKSPHPLINLRIFKHWKFSFVAASYLLTCMVSGGVMYMLPYYMEIPLGLSAATAGLLLIISSVITALIGIPVGIWCDKIGCRTPCILAALCRITFCAILLFILPEWGIIAVLPALVFTGLAFGISGGPATTRIVQNAPEGETGSGTSIMITTDFLGGVVGIAAYTLAFVIGAPAAAGIAVNELPVDIFLSGFHATAFLGLLIGIATLILSWVVPNIVAGKEAAKKEEGKVGES